MKVEITGRHIEVTPALRAFVQQHLEKIPRVLGDNIALHIILGVERRRHICEIVLKSKTAQLACREATTDMYASITRAAHKMEQQALKNKKRRVEVKRRRTELLQRGSVTGRGMGGVGAVSEPVSKQAQVGEEP